MAYIRSAVDQNVQNALQGRARQTTAAEILGITSTIYDLGL
jgi:hypothetical protein